MVERWRIELLGGLRACGLPYGGRLITRFRTHKTGALLAYLAYNLRQQHPREVLIEMLWPASPPETGRNNLRLALASLRRQLEPPQVPTGSVIQANRVAIGLDPTAIVTDVAAFESSLAATRVAAGAERARLLTQAVELYHGRLLSGYYESWIPAEEARLEELFLSAQRQLLTSLEQQGDVATALRIAQRVATVAPIPTAVRIGESVLTHRTKAVDTSAPTQPATRRLSDVPKHPAPEARRRASDKRAKKATSARARPRTSASANSHWPLPLTRFFGRETALASLIELLQAQDTRLITLTGPGGSGKTRLALELGQRLGQSAVLPWRDAAWFVALADLQDAALISDAIADALYLPHSSQDALDNVSAALARQPSFLVLDNFEQITEDGAPLLSALLRRVPQLTCLVTSRQRLNIAGEHEFRVAPLATPVAADEPVEQLARYESVQLFLDRAQVARPDFQLTRANALDLAHIARALEGIPLAIELVAARMGTLTPAQVLANLKTGLDFFASRQRDATPRHRSLRACIEWSYQTLTPALQHFYARLSIFRGGWTLAAAQAVCQEPHALDYLEQLREASLIFVKVTPEANTETDPPVVRFRMLETLRDYAGERLNDFEPDVLEPDGLAQRHAEYYVAVAERAEHARHEGQPGGWHGWSFEDIDNFRTVLDWSSQSGQLELGLRLSAALWWLWSGHGHLAEWRERLRQLLALATAAGPQGGAGAQAVTAKTLANAATGAGFLAFYQSDYAVARAYFESSLEHWRALDDLNGIASALNGLGAVALAQGQHELARRDYEASLSVHRQGADQRGVAISLSSLAGVAHAGGDNDLALRLCAEALPIWHALGDDGGPSWLLSIEGQVAASRGDYAAAQAFQERSLAIRRSLGSKTAIATTLYDLGRIAVAQGQGDKAYDFFVESLALRREAGHRRDMVNCLEGLAAVWSLRGEWQRAAQLLAAGPTLRAALGAPRPLYEQSAFEQVQAAAQASLGATAFAVAGTLGQMLNLEQAIAIAIAPL